MLWNPAIAALGGVVIGGLLNFMVSRIQEKQRYRIDNLQKQEQVYSQLYGLKSTTTQLHQSCGEASVEFAWSYALERLELPKRSRFEETREIIRKHDNLLLEIARNDQHLHETIGLIRILFPPSKELDAHIEGIEGISESFQSMEEQIKQIYSAAELGNVDDLENDACKSVNDTVDIHIKAPLQALIHYLEEVIKVERKSLRR